jgi:hypothetical protein
MATLLDILGSVITGGIVILAIVNLNIKMVDNGREKATASFTQSDINTSVQILDHFFYKIGYRVPGDKIAQADSNKIKFFSDIDNDGVVDSISIYTTTTTWMTSTKNPNDRPLFLIYNNSSPVLLNVITQFQLTYYDSSGSIIPPGLLLNPNDKRGVRSIKIFMKTESGDPFYAHETNKQFYQAAEWSKIVKPKNLIF